VSKNLLIISEFALPTVLYVFECNFIFKFFNRHSSSNQTEKNQLIKSFWRKQEHSMVLKVVFLELE